MADDKKCMWKEIYENQLNEEMQRGAGEIGTTNYREIGCDKCDGYDTTCLKYQTKKLTRDEIIRQNLERIANNNSDDETARSFVEKIGLPMSMHEEYLNYYQGLRQQEN